MNSGEYLPHPQPTRLLENVFKRNDGGRADNVIILMLLHGHELLGKYCSSFLFCKFTKKEINSFFIIIIEVSSVKIFWIF